MCLMVQIIGCAEVKRELHQIADTIRNPEIYTSIGAKIPRNLLIRGKKRIGKTMMAKALMEEMQMPAYTICRADAGDDFIQRIQQTFADAKRRAPAAVLLDDLDQYAAVSSAEVYSVVRACIDEARSRNVFVIATAVNLKSIPETLLCEAYFDRLISVSQFDRETEREYIKACIRNRPLADDIDPQDAVILLMNRSRADIEAVLNEAAMYAGFDRAAEIGRAHLIRAYLHILYGDSIEDDGTPEEAEKLRQLQTDAYHVAGHIIAGEIALPDSMAFAFISTDRRSIARRYRSFSNVEQEVLTCLGGIAAEEMRFGRHSANSDCNVEKALSALQEVVCNGGTLGYRYVDIPSIHMPDSLVEQQCTIIHHEFDRYLMKAKQIMAENSALLETIAKELMEKRVLLHSDICGLPTVSASSCCRAEKDELSPP